jgi:uncharacterized protein
MPQFQEISNWIDASILVITPESRATLTGFFSDPDTSLGAATELLQSADLGIEKTEVFQRPLDQDEVGSLHALVRDRLSEDLWFPLMPGRELHIDSEGDIFERGVSLSHRGEGGTILALNFQDESDGTKRLMDYMPIFLGFIDRRNLLIVVDEIERSLHPQVAQMLIRRLRADLTTRGEGQVIFTTHLTSLMSKEFLRQDEVWMTDKDDEGFSTLTNFSEFNIRADARWDASYLDARVGGVPRIGHSTKTAS